MIKKIFAALGILVALILLIAGVWIGSHWQLIKDFQPMASGAYSKFMCSCMFVEGRAEEECHNWSRLILPIQTCDIDGEAKTVTVKALGYTSTAAYVKDRYGCTLK